LHRRRPPESEVGLLDDIVDVAYRRKGDSEVRAKGDLMGMHFIGEPPGLF
jgi:hypothetical protein